MKERQAHEGRPSNGWGEVLLRREEKVEAPKGSLGLKTARRRRNMERHDRGTRSARTKRSAERPNYHHHSWFGRLPQSEWASHLFLSPLFSPLFVFRSAKSSFLLVLVGAHYFRRKGRYDTNRPFVFEIYLATLVKPRSHGTATTLRGRKGYFLSFSYLFRVKRKVVHGCPGGRNEALGDVCF